MATTDLTPQEQTNVRTALRFLRLRSGGWKPLAKALHCDDKQLGKVVAGRGGVSASLALRVARFARASVDDLLEGRYPSPNTCPHCGNVLDRPISSDFVDEETTPGIPIREGVA